MNKTEAENYLLEKYDSLLRKYLDLHSKAFEYERITRVDIGIMLVKVFNKRISIFTFYFILKWFNAFVFYWLGAVSQAIVILIVIPYKSFQYANKEVSMKKCFKDYYFLLKHYKELRAFRNQTYAFKKEFDKEKEKEKEEDLDDE